MQQGNRQMCLADADRSNQQKPAPDTGIPWHTISIAPFLVGLLRYAVDVDAGTAAEPEDIVFRDRVLQVIGVVWLVTVCLGVLTS